MGAVFTIVLIIIFVIVIGLTCGGDEEDKKPTDTNKDLVKQEPQLITNYTTTITYEEPWTWTVYVHISPTGRAYVGQTRQKPVTKRWANGKGYKNNPDFWEDICYYGWENFQHIILRENIPTWESCQRSERYYIRKYDAFETGYNRDKGGARKRRRSYD